MPTPSESGQGGQGGQGPSLTVFEIFLLLLLTERPVHGHHLVRLLKDLGFGSNHRSVYRALHRLEAGGLLCSQREVSSRGAARMYRLTPVGHEALQASAQSRRRMASLLREYRSIESSGRDHGDSTGGGQDGR